MLRSYATPLRLSAEDRSRLETWTRRHKTSQSLAQRARIVLAGASRSSVASSSVVLSTSSRRV